jgi:molecular chaperone DnaJ
MERDFDNIERDFKEFFSMDFDKSGKDSRIKGRDINATMWLTFEESCVGARKPLNLEKNVKCEVCKGSGVEPNSAPVDCIDCGGMGEVSKSLNMYTGTCRTCNGTGK